MSKRAYVRGAAAVTGVTAVALSSLLLTTPAQADEPLTSEAPTNEVETADAVVSNALIDPGAHEEGTAVVLEDRGRLNTKLIGLQTDDGATLKTYCVEIDVNVRPDAEMEEREWDDHPSEDTLFHQNRAEILWILQNAYPVVDTDELADAADVRGDLSKEDAIGATQAALWHYSDGTDLRAARGAVGDVYDYLTGDANEGIDTPPEPALSVTPESLEGEAGDELGPFVVSTNADEVTLASDEVPGAELRADESITDGSEIFVDVAPDAEAGALDFELSAEAALNVGRLFVGAQYFENPTQSLILASSDRTKLKVDAGAKWEAAPTEPTPEPTPEPTEEPTEEPTPEPTEEPSASPTPTESPSETPAPSESPDESPEPEETTTPGPDEELPDTGATSTGVMSAAILLLMLGGAALVLRRRVGTEA